jgi:DNA-binding NarL/FixJ family response regulator
MPITVTLISPQPGYRTTLARHLNQASAFHCVGSYASLADLVSRCACAPSDIVLFDTDFAEPGWLDQVGRARALSAAMQLIVLGPAEDAERIFQALARGACGFILRTEPPGQILRLLEEAQKGAPPIPAPVALRLVNHLHQHTLPRQEVDNLSLREKEILEFLARGYPYKQIAGHLAISINTVRTYIRRLYTKLQVPCRAHAVLKCRPVFGIEREDWVSKAVPKPAKAQASIA